MTRFGRRDESLPDLIAEAGLAALADAGIERPDALVVAAMNPEEFTGAGNYASLVNTHLGLSDVPALRVETATSSGVAAVYTAFATIAAGIHRSVLVVGGEKMSHVPTPRVSICMSAGGPAWAPRLLCSSSRLASMPFARYSFTPLLHRPRGSGVRHARPSH